MGGARSAVSRAEAFRYWLRLGFTSFGGPAGQIAIMHRELVVSRRWISEKRFLHALNYCMVLPGPEAQQLATYLGWLMHGAWGGVVAGVLFVLPSLAILIVLSWVYVTFNQLPLIAGMLAGIKPAIVAVVFFAAWRIARRTLRSVWHLAIALLAFLAFALRVPFALILLTAALAGWLTARLDPPATALADAGTHRDAEPTGPAVIDDDTPTPPHARHTLARLACLTALFVGIWVATLAAVATLDGHTGFFANLARFFTQAALVTFGGAYAVLPFVFQGAVEQYQWLSANQMIDGLALGETTPGPLIMIVAYIGFLGGWNLAPLGTDLVLWAALAGSVTATFFTFLPSFLFILAGAPLIEKTRANLKVVAPLAGISAAVVGIIAHLTVFFAWHAWWPTGGSPPSAAGLDWFALALTLGAACLLIRHDLSVVKLIALAALAGATRTLLQGAL
jgi:chromate transporter